MRNIVVSLCLHLFVAQGLFFDLLKQPSDKKISSRRGLSFSSSSKSSSSSSSSKYSSSSSSSSKHSSDKRQKKKVAYVCSSAGYSASVKAQYGCGARVPSVPGVSASSDAALLSTRNSFLTKTSQPCYDDNKYCASWASLSECSSNPAWMLPHCPIACGLCDLCEDFNQYCGAWAGRGECSRNNKYMDIYCKKSCGVCGSGLTPPPAPTTTTTPPPPPPSTTRRPAPRPPAQCRDRKYKCGRWAGQGYCHAPKYYYYMKKHCPLSCRHCHRSP